MWVSGCVKRLPRTDAFGSGEDAEEDPPAGKRGLLGEWARARVG